jgi:hypothetical protein
VNTTNTKETKVNTTKMQLSEFIYAIMNEAKMASYCVHTDKETQIKIIDYALDSLKVRDRELTITANQNPETFAPEILITANITAEVKLASNGK